MNEQTRYRVTGCLFLFALAVVILPMLFDGDGLPAVQVPKFPEAAIPMTVIKPAARLNSPDDGLVQGAEDLRSSFDREGFHRNGTRHGDPILQPVTAQSELFAVQLGTFADVDNALMLRDRAREDGFEAFTSTTKAGGSRRIRVAVGPYMNRAKAETILTKLSARYRLNARLMAIAETQNGNS